MMEEDKEEKKGFRVVDKRISAQEAAQKEKPKKEKKGGKKKEAQPQETQEAKQDASPKQPPPLPELNFASFIYSLSTSALVHLGEIPEPITEKMDKNLPLAKQTIDILGIIQEKTKGNLTQEEETLLNNFLYDLRMRYVKSMG